VTVVTVGDGSPGSSSYARAQEKKAGQPSPTVTADDNRMNSFTSQAEAQMNLGYIVLHSDTGAMDGIYFEETTAKQMLTHWRAEVAGQWLLLAITDWRDSHSRYPSIPDHLFAPTALAAHRRKRA
jgi:hypothetical protein